MDEYSSRKNKSHRIFKTRRPDYTDSTRYETEKFYTALLTLLMMTAESMLSKHLVLRMAVASFFLNIEKFPRHCFYADWLKN